MRIAIILVLLTAIFLLLPQCVMSAINPSLPWSLWRVETGSGPIGPQYPTPVLALPYPWQLGPAFLRACDLDMRNDLQEQGVSGAVKSVSTIDSESDQVDEYNPHGFMTRHSESFDKQRKEGRDTPPNNFNAYTVLPGGGVQNAYVHYDGVTPANSALLHMDYDMQGRPTKVTSNMVMYTADAKKVTIDTAILSFSYDAQGKLSEVTETHDGWVQHRMRALPVPQGRQYELCEFQPRADAGKPEVKPETLKGRSLLTFDAQGRCVESKTFDGEQVQQEIATWTYSGQRITRTLRSIRPDDASDIVVYNAAGRMLWRKIYNNAGVLILHITCSYDQHGNNASYQKTTPGEKSPGEKTSYTYEYDAHGNWIKCTSHAYGPYVTTRKIVYYNK